MKCSVCQKESDKIIEKCNLGRIVCVKCCFHVSSGAPQFIDYLKKDAKLTKEIILKKCSECNLPK